MSDSNPGLMTIFSEALALTDAAERKGYLDRVCRGDVALRQRVEELLAAQPGMGRFLEPAGHAAEMPTATSTYSHADATGTWGTVPPVSVPSGLAVGTVIAGRYTLVEVIGEGGMGSVYLATQTEPVKRQVALKLIKSGMDSKTVVARFDAERQALALMDHPNIARVYDGGTTDRGQPFFVMELVRGLPLTEYCDQRRLCVSARLELFVQVCHAVQHAHQKGIIHRDLKPSNVLITEVDGRPTPKVIDFGVAKATEIPLTDMSYADTGAIVGTPAYMSPEQADPTCVDIDTRTDVYALGVILYELLTGSPPIDSRQFKRGAILEILRMVREVDPPRPSTKLSEQAALANIAANRSIEPAKLAKSLRGELDWVVMKAIEKDRTRRYDTANGFARDIQRYLADEVVEARPPSTGYRLRKYVYRHKGQVLAVSLILFALMGGIAGTTLGLFRAEQRRSDAEQSQKAETARVKERDAALKSEAERSEELQHQLGVSAMVLAATAYEARDPEVAAERLVRVPAQQRGWEWRYIQHLSRGGMFTLPGLRQGPYSAECTAIAFTPDGQRILLATRNSGMMQAALHVWDARTGTLVHECKDIKASVKHIAFSADGATMVTLEADQIGLDPSASTIKVWDTKTWTLSFALSKPKDAVLAIALSGDGQRLVTAGDRLKVWNLATKEQVLELDSGKLDPDNRLLSGVALSPDGQRIAACGLRGNVRIWDAQKGGPAMTTFNLPRVGGPIHFPDVMPYPSGILMIGLAYSPDGKRLLAGYSNGTAKVLDATTGTTAFELTSRNRAKVQEVIREGTILPHITAFSPDGSRIVLAGGDYGPDEATVWDARTGKELLALTGHTGIVRCAAFSPDGTRLVTGSEDGTAKVWNARTGDARFEFDTDRAALATAFSPIDDRLVVAGKKTTIIDGRTGAVVHDLDGLPGGARCVAYNKDGTRFIVAGGDFRSTGGATVHDARTGAVLFPLDGLKAPVHDVAFSPDGAWIATTAIRTRDKPFECKIWDARNGTLLHDLTRPVRMTNMRERGGTIAFHPDGTQFVTGCVTGAYDATVWDAKTLQPVLTLRNGNDVVHRVGYSADGTRLFVAANQTVTIRDARSGVPHMELRGHAGEVMTAAFNADGSRIVTGGTDRTVRLWDARTGTTFLEWKGHLEKATCAAFNRTGTQIAAVIEKQGVIVWDAPMSESLPALRGLGSPLSSATFSPDGRRVVTVALDGSAKIWKVQTATVELELLAPEGGIGSVRFTPDGRQLVTQGWRNKGDMVEPHTQVHDAFTGEVLPDAKTPDTVPPKTISPDERWFAHVTGTRVEFILLKPNDAELARRHRQAMPDIVQLRRRFEQALAVKDDFAARFTIRFLPEKERPRREAQLAVAHGKQAEAIVWYQKACTLAPRDAELHIALGRVFRDAGRKPESLACYLKAIELDESFATVGDTVMESDPELAIACYRKAVQVYPGHASLQQRLTLLLKKLGKRDEAIAALRVRVAQEPKNAKAHAELADNLWDDGQREAAFAAYRTTSEYDTDPERLLQLAILQAWFGRDKELAETQQRAAKRFREGTRPTRSALECFLSPAADPKAAQETLRGMRELVNANPQPYLWQRLTIGMGEFRTGNFAAAIETLRLASEARKPTDGFMFLPPVADSYRAMALYQVGKKDEAKALLEQVATAIKLVPRDEELTTQHLWNPQELLGWLAFKEATLLINPDKAVPPAKK